MATKLAGVQHTIWSTLEDIRNWVPLDDNRIPTIEGRYKARHFDRKGEADKIFTEFQVPTTFLLTSFYWDNFISDRFCPRKEPDGKLALKLPMDDKKLPGIAAEDIGKCAYGIFKRGCEFIGKKVGIAGEHLTGTQMAAAFTKALGQEVQYVHVAPEEYRRSGLKGAEDLGNAFQFKCEFEEYYCGARDPNFTRALNPGLQTFEVWLAQNKNRITPR